MEGRFWFFVGMFGMVAFVLLIQSCGYDEPFPPEAPNGDASAQGKSAPYAPNEIRSESNVAADAGIGEEKSSLCMNSKWSMEPEITLYELRDGETCLPDRRSNSFLVQKDWPQKVSLYGFEGKEYCVGVERQSGYITISHESGDVNRDGDFFTWCVVPNSPEPETMLIRSLTPEAVIFLHVP